MTHAVIFNDKYLVSSSVFNVDKHTEMKYDAADLLTPYGFFVPLGEGGMSLLRCLRTELYKDQYGKINPSVMPPHGTKMRGVLVGSILELVTFFPREGSKDESMLLVSTMPGFGNQWKVLETGVYHHDCALSLAVQKCRTPKTAADRLNEFTAGKMIEPLIFDLDKLRKLEAVKKWQNLKSDIISHDLKL